MFFLRASRLVHCVETVEEESNARQGRIAGAENTKIAVLVCRDEKRGAERADLKITSVA